MLKRLALAVFDFTVVGPFAFAGIVIPSVFVLALLTAHPAHPQSMQLPGCDRNLANASASVAAMQARMKSLGTARASDTCTATRLYFLEVVKARAVTAVCKSGPEKERELGRFDADVEHINEAIAARCS
jgi:hypothetical protein